AGFQRTLMHIEYVAHRYAVVLQAGTRSTSWRAAAGGLRSAPRPCRSHARLPSREAARLTATKDDERTRLAPRRHGDDAKAISLDDRGTLASGARWGCSSTLANLGPDHSGLGPAHDVSLADPRDLETLAVAAPAGLTRDDDVDGRGPVRLEG